MENWKLLSEEPTYKGGRGHIQKIIGQTDSVGFFSFCPAASRQSTALADRCDDGLRWGPVSFHQQVDGVCNCGNVDIDASTADTCSIGYASLTSMSYSIPILSEPPIGYMGYQECSDPLIDELFCRQHWNCNARTLQELFKLMYEWSDFHTLLGDNAPISTVAHDLLVILEVPQEVEDWVRTQMPDGPVVRFLNDDPAARDRPSNIPDMPDSFSRWLWYRLDEIFSYGKLNSKNV